MSLPEKIVFLVDVDNTLFDNDHMQHDIRAFVDREYGAEAGARYWDLQEQVFQEVGYRDYLEAMQRYRREHPNDMRLLSLSAWISRYPCANRVLPGALDVLARLRSWGTTAIVSDGDVFYQPQKIWRSGIHEAVEGNVLVYIHKEEALDDILQRHPADHYVFIDDKPRLLDAFKKAWGDRVTTVWPRQGKFALSPEATAAYPDAADVTIQHIGDLLTIELADLLAHRGVAAVRKVLVVDIGGTSVKFVVDGQGEARHFPSGKEMTPAAMVDKIREMSADLDYDAVSVGYPGPVLDNRPLVEPHNLAPGWVGFDFEAAFGRPTRIVNDAAMQALGGYRGGRMLFLGFGTGLGSTLIVDGALMPMEIARLPYKDSTYEDYTGIRAVERLGEDAWRACVSDVVARLTDVLEPDDIVLGGGNVHRLESLPPRCRRGDNENAFVGGARMWEPGALRSGWVPAAAGR